MPATDPTTTDPISAVDRTADELRHALFAGEFEPGAPLREVALATSLGVSRSTVREALALLVSEGLADRATNKGTVVHALTAAEVRDICRARLVLESAGIDHWATAEEDAREAVRRSLREFSRLTRRPASPQAVTAAHLAIHRSLAELTGSRRLIAMADSLYAELRLALAGLDRARRNLREQAHAHSDLLDLLESGEVSKARELLVEHLAGAETSLLDTVVDRPTRLAP